MMMLFQDNYAIGDHGHVANYFFDNDTIDDHGDGANDGVDFGDDAHDDDGVRSIVTTIRIMINTLPVHLAHRCIVTISSSLHLMMILVDQVLVNLKLCI